MTGAIEKAARAAVQSQHWHWMPGMLCMRIDKGAGLGEDDYVARARFVEPSRTVTDGVFPDLDDPATLGCLLALVRERWRDNTAAQMRLAWGWQVVGGVPGYSIEYGQPMATEAEALCAALCWEFSFVPDEWPDVPPW
jgi:hypothetical protein